MKDLTPDFSLLGLPAGRVKSEKSHPDFSLFGGWSKNENLQVEKK